MIMKYFTMEWWCGLQDPDTHKEDPGAAYAAHIEALRDRVPASLLELDRMNLHDGRLRALRTSVGAGTIELDLECDDSGELARIRLLFHGVRALEFVGNPEISLPGPGGFGDLGYWEIDQAGACVEFRALFSTGIEMRIEFLEVSAGSW